MDLKKTKNSFIECSRQIFDSTENISSESYGIVEIFTKKKLKAAKSQLAMYYSWLREFDKAYTEQLTLGGAPNDLNMKNAKLSVVERSREVFLSSLNGYEKELSNIEASTNFKLSTGIAISAIAISLLGVLIA